MDSVGINPLTEATRGTDTGGEDMTMGKRQASSKAALRCRGDRPAKSTEGKMNPKESE